MHRNVFLRRATLHYKRKFKPHRLPTYPVLQSKQVKLGNHRYILLGQQTLKEGPLITNFIVYNEKGMAADDKIASELYEVATISATMKYLQSLQQTFEKQQKFLDEKDCHGMGAISTMAYESWLQLRKVSASLRGIKVWTAKELAHLKESWQQFWRTYEERASLLIELVRGGFTRGMEKKKLINLQDYNLYEALIISKVFFIEEFYIKKDPLDFTDWIKFSEARANVNKRKQKLSTHADHQSQEIVNVIKYIFIYGLTLYALILIYQKKFELLFFIVLAYILFFSFYYFNTYRLRQTFIRRMLPLWKEKRGKEDIPVFSTLGTSISMPSNVLLIGLVAIGIFIYNLFDSGWDGLAEVLLVFSILVIGLGVWVPYSPFVEKTIVFYPDRIESGHLVFDLEQIEKIIVDKDGVSYHFYISYLNEDYEVRIENEFQSETKPLVETWCRNNSIQLEEKGS